MIQVSLTDPPQQSVILPAIQWVEALFLGNLATIIAIVAVASIGFAMLNGWIDLKRGGTILLGCFILFGASTIANGLRNAAQSADVQYPTAAPVPPPAFVRPPQAESATSYDPYAGASVPR